MSTSPAVTRLASIMTRHCQISIAASPDWDTEFYLDKFCLAEGNFWRENLTTLKTRQFFKPILSHSKIVYSDASSYACGALIKGTEQGPVVRKPVNANPGLRRNRGYNFFC